MRLVDTIDSETSQQGQTFHATLDSPLAVDGDVVIPSGYDVEGHLVEVKKRGQICRPVGGSVAIGPHFVGRQVLQPAD